MFPATAAPIVVALPTHRTGRARQVDVAEFLDNGDGWRRADVGDGPVSPHDPSVASTPPTLTPISEHAGHWLRSEPAVAARVGADEIAGDHVSGAPRPANIDATPKSLAEMTLPRQCRASRSDRRSCCRKRCLDGRRRCRRRLLSLPSADRSGDVGADVVTLDNVVGASMITDLKANSALPEMIFRGGGRRAADRVVRRRPRCIRRSRWHHRAGTAVPAALVPMYEPCDEDCRYCRSRSYLREAVDRQRLDRAAVGANARSSPERRSTWCLQVDERRPGIAGLAGAVDQHRHRDIGRCC